MMKVSGYSAAFRKEIAKVRGKFIDSSQTEGANDRHKKKINAKAEWFKLKRGSTKDNSVPDSEHTHDKPVG